MLLMFGGGAAFGYGKFSPMLDDPSRADLVSGGAWSIGFGFCLGTIHCFLSFFDRRLPGRGSPATRPRIVRADDTWPDIR